MVNNSKKGLIVIIFLVIILVGVIVAGTIKEKRDSKVLNQEYINSVKTSEIEEENQQVDNNNAENIDVSKVKGLGEKLRAKVDVRVLVLGDGIAMSQGRNSDNGIWSEGVKNLIETTYGSKVTMTLLAQQGATTETGVTAVRENDIKNYDLVIICYGQNDNNKSLKTSDVKNYYKSIVDKIRNESPDASIIAVLESTLELNNVYRNAIQEVATANYLNVADMKNAFLSSGVKESTLVSSSLPNDQGYQVYTQTIGNTIRTILGQ